MKRNIILSVVTLLGLACLGLILICLGGYFVIANNLISIPAAKQSVQCPAIQQPQDVKDSLAVNIAKQMDEIQQQVITLRGLCPKSVIPRDMLSKDELRKRVKEDFFKNYSRQDAEDDVKTLAALGLVDSGFNLYDLYINLYSEQIAGYYDDKTKEMFVVNQMDFGGPERATYSHEYTHVLQDQNYDLLGRLRLGEEDCKKDSERCSAVSALVEGDATYLESDWLARFGTKVDKSEVQNFALTFSSPVLDSSPKYLQEDFLFPYREGNEFVATIYDQGGWNAVNSVYSNLPTSTEQILHPALYPSDKPVKVILPDLKAALGSSWRELDKEVMGEWSTFLVLAYGKQSNFRLPLDKARQAAAGWGGDLFATYADETSKTTLFMYRSNWDTLKDADEFWQGLQEYGKMRWGAPVKSGGNYFEWSSATEGIVIFSRDANNVLWMNAPTIELAGKVLELMPDFKNG